MKVLIFFNLIITNNFSMVMNFDGIIDPTFNINVLDIKDKSHVSIYNNSNLLSTISQIPPDGQHYIYINNNPFGFQISKNQYINLENNDMINDQTFNDYFNGTWNDYSFKFSSHNFNDYCNNQLTWKENQEFFINWSSIIFIPNLFLLFYPLKKFFQALMYLRGYSDLMVDKYCDLYLNVVQNLIKNNQIELSYLDKFLNKDLIDKINLKIQIDEKLKNHKDFNIINFQSDYPNYYTTINLIQKNINNTKENNQNNHLLKITKILQNNILINNVIIRNIKLFFSNCFFLIGKPKNYIAIIIDFNNSYGIFHGKDLINDDNFKIFYVYILISFIANIMTYVFTISNNHNLYITHPNENILTSLIFTYINMFTIIIAPCILYCFRYTPLVYVVDIFLTLLKLILIWIKSGIK